jgi:hypothetical protein
MFHKCETAGGGQRPPGPISALGGAGFIAPLRDVQGPLPILDVLQNVESGEVYLKRQLPTGRGEQQRAPKVCET